MSRGDRLLVFTGAAVGTAIRYASFRIWFHRPGTFPATTLVVNALGAFVLGVLVVVIAERADARRWYWFARVGVLGGFTTFSAYAVEVAQYWRDNAIAVGVVYAVAMSTLGIVAAFAGLHFGRHFAPRRREIVR